MTKLLVRQASALGRMGRLDRAIDRPGRSGACRQPSVFSAVNRFFL